MTTKIEKLSLGQMEDRNVASGKHWFDDDSMKFFNTRIEEHPNDYGLFITSEADERMGIPRKHTVRIFTRGNDGIDSVGPFCQMTKSKALKFREAVTNALEKMGNRELAIFHDLRFVSEWIGSPENCFEFMDAEGNSFVIRVTDSEIIQ